LASVCEESYLLVGLDPAPTPTRLTQYSCHAAVMARHTSRPVNTAATAFGGVSLQHGSAAQQI